MVLEAELNIRTEEEVGIEPAQTPDNLAAGAIDFMDRTCITGGDQVVALRVFVHGVDVEVVPRI